MQENLEILQKIKLENIERMWFMEGMKSIKETKKPPAKQE